MAMSIRDGRPVDDNWQQAADGKPLPEGDVIVDLDRWRAEGDTLRAHAGRVGLLLRGGDDLSAILPELGRIPLVAIDFPTYNDGRGYSLARLLRGAHGYRGELRAVGDVRRDQADLMRRCGFDSLEPAEGQSPAAIREAFGEIRPYPWQP